MAWVILGLGLALCVSGAAALWSGVSYMPVEWGWSQIIAGATALSGGVVTIGLAAVVHHLRALKGAILGLTAPQAAAEDLVPEASARAEVPQSAEPPEPEPPAERVPPRPSSRPILVPPPAADEMSAGSNGHGRRVGIADVVGLENPPPDPEVADGVSTVPPPGLDEGSVEPAETGADAAIPAETDGVGRTVVGRYEAGGASYALFSDGTIEVETETGTHRFGSMDELKAFLELQDRAGQSDWPE